MQEVDALLIREFPTGGAVLACLTMLGQKIMPLRTHVEAKTAKPITSYHEIARQVSWFFYWEDYHSFGQPLLEALILKGFTPQVIRSKFVDSPWDKSVFAGIALLTITSLLTAVIKSSLKKAPMYSVETWRAWICSVWTRRELLPKRKMQVEAVLPLTETYRRGVASILDQLYYS